MDALITVGTAIQRTTEAIRLGALVGAAGHRITTTALAVERGAARLDPHLVAAARLAVPVDDHHLVVAVPGQVAAALAHHPRVRLLVVEAHGHPVAVLVQPDPVLAVVPREHPVAAALAHPELDGPAHLVLAHHQVALAQRVHHLAAVHRALEAPVRAVASLVAEAAVHAPVVEASLVAEVVAPAPVAEDSSVVEAVRAPAAEVSSVAVVADAGPADLVASEAAEDDRFGLCNRRRLGFNHAA